MTNKEREFVGFLFGEGCFRISRHKKKGWGEGRFLYRTDVSVSLRDDDASILEWAKSNYGGTLLYREPNKTHPNEKPFVMWILTSAITVKKICEQCLKAELPTVKRRQIKLLLDVCKLKIKRKKFGHKTTKTRWYTDEEYNFQEEAYKKLSEYKIYRSRE